VVVVVSLSGWRDPTPSRCRVVAGGIELGCKIVRVKNDGHLSDRIRRSAARWQTNGTQRWRGSLPEADTGADGSTV
jgi:hypothetical protein